jgi:hypothetical protein
MKDQYVGDLSDYVKYGLLRGLCEGTLLRLAVCWMRTPDDDTGHGRDTGYLEQKGMGRFDPGLFGALKSLEPKAGKNRSLAVVERLGILPAETFIRDLVPEKREQRAAYFRSVVSACAEHDLVFFDPDNGLQTDKFPDGAMRSDKHIYLDELDAVFMRGCSVVTFQTLIRKVKKRFIPELVKRLGANRPRIEILVFHAGRVGFFLICQPWHLKPLTTNAHALVEQWKPQIKLWR